MTTRKGRIEDFRAPICGLAYMTISGRDFFCDGGMTVNALSDCYTDENIIGKEIEYAAEGDMLMSFNPIA